MTSSKVLSNSTTMQSETTDVDLNNIDIQEQERILSEIQERGNSNNTKNQPDVDSNAIARALQEEQDRQLAIRLAQMQDPVSQVKNGKFAKVTVGFGFHNSMNSHNRKQMVEDDDDEDEVEYEDEYGDYANKYFKF